MPLATTTYESTDKDNVISSDLVPKKTFNASTEEQEVISQVLKRFSAMKSARSRIDTDWSTWQKIIESKYYRYPDGRTRVNVPIFRALQELFVSEATTRKIEKEIKPVGLSDIDKVEVMNEVWDYDWNKNRRDEEMTDAEYKCCAYGTTAYFTGFEQTERIISDPSVDDDGLISYKKKLMKQGRIILKTVDIRNVYFDDRTNNFDDDIDQIYIDYITPEQFRMEMNDPNLMNTDSVGTVAKTEQMYYTWEDTGKMNTGYVEKMHYWNKGADKYIILYNRGILGRNSPIPYAHKELPIVPRQFGKVMDSKYGRGLAEACMQFLEKYNKLSEMIFDGISRSNNSIFALGNGVTFDSNTLSFSNQFVKFSGTLDDAHFREIKGQPPNSTAFEYLQELLKEIAIFIGIDISQVIGTPNGTAFETAQKVESSLKRVNVILTNRDYALQKVFTRHLANMMQFVSISDVARITELTEDGKKAKEQKSGFKKILLDGKEFNKDTKKLVEKPGKFEFECDPEYIRGQMDITVQTNFNSPALRSLKQEALSRFMDDITKYGQAIQINPELAKAIKPDDFIKECAMTWNVDIDSIGGFADSDSKAWDEMMKKVQEMAGNTMAPPMPGQGQPQVPGQPPQESSTGMGLLPNVSQTGMPPVRTPDIPNINQLGAGEKVMM